MHMSLQRVFESARKLGLPVVVTDPAGREPFVLVPLDQFEAMAGVGKNDSALHVEEKREVSPSVELITEEVPEMQEIPLEERFYVETAQSQGGE